MKHRLLAATVTVAIFVPPVAIATAAPPDYHGSRFATVWTQVQADPYPRLPHEIVTLASFFGFLENKLLGSSRRTLTDRRDLLPPFQKLLHPNGICLAGTWQITEPTPYTGVFRTGASALFIGRASTALTNTVRGDYRAFGLAGKVFPTLDPDELVETANFFTIEDLGGTMRDHFLDAVNTNDIGGPTITRSALENAGVGVAAAAAFTAAEGTLDSARASFRQLYPLAEAREAHPDRAVGPTWMAIVGSADVSRVDADDFRDELRLANYPDGLRFDVWVADRGTRDGAKDWHRIGVIEITDDAVSASCDHRLHFAHPPGRGAFPR